MSQSLIVVTQQETGMYNQTWFYGGSGNSLQEDKIKEYWNEDFYINSVAYTSKVINLRGLMSGFKRSGNPDI